MTSKRPSTLGPTTPGFQQERDDDSVMSGGMFWLAVVVVFLIMVVLAIRFGTSSIEADIESRANGLLEANGLTTVNVEASGTDVELTGSIDEGRSEEAIFAAVASLGGVSSVEGKLWPISAGTNEDIEIVGDSVEIEWSGSSVIVRGDLSTQERKDSVESALGEAFARVDVDSVGVVEGLADESSWLGKALSLVLTSKETLPEGLVIMAPSQKLLVLSGDVETKAERNSLNDHAKEIGAEIGFDVNPAVRAPESDVPTQEEVDELQVDLNALLEGQVVEFRVGSDEITDKGKALLDEILTTIALAPDIKIEIAGHADAAGSAARNMILSEDRANSVLDYLVAAGQNADRFVVVWFGDTQAIGDNSTEEGRALNRRIEFRALLAEEDA
jgi:OOP family OmpA-OmpF porin